MHARAFSRNEASYGRGSEDVNRMHHLETGVLYCGDNLERLSVLPSESVDLIYLDPPFFSNKNYEVIWGDEAEVRSFEASCRRRTLSGGADWRTCWPAWHLSC